MSLIAMIGFVFGGLAAAAWIVAADRLLPGPGATDSQPNAPHAGDAQRLAAEGARR